MKQELAFITSDDFEDFTSQLIALELPGFMAVEGSGGDGGLDGLDGTTAYQMYFPEPKHRDAKHYISKIDQTLSRVQNTIKEQELEITRWILVIPQDAHFTVVAHLQRKSKETGIECLYWGATHLTALLARHPQIRDNFPEILLPDVKSDLGEVKTSLTRMSVPRTEHNVEIVTDEDYQKQREALRDELRMRFRSAQSLPGSAAMAASNAYRSQMEKRFLALDTKKAASDRAYDLDFDDIKDHLEQELKKKESDLAQRGMSSAGFGLQELDDIRQRWHREVERLRMKYGKEGVYQL
ncbi:MAG TPA: hypothetical protein VK497_04045 [Candidatus Saccharimonadales bacterium]|nr:hypothetical protein [Candidatus Saccharimonadales bacterium]